MFYLHRNKNNTYYFQTDAKENDDTDFNVSCSVDIHLENENIENEVVFDSGNFSLETTSDDNKKVPIFTEYPQRNFYKRKCWRRNTKNKNEVFSNIPTEIYTNNLLKYWNNRYRLFEKFDEGILLDTGNFRYCFLKY